MIEKRNLQAFIVGFTLLGAVVFSVFIPVYAADPKDLNKEKKTLEKKISTEQKKVKQVQQELVKVKRTLSTTRYRVSRIEDELERISAEIKQREERLSALKKQREFQKDLLKRAVREIYALEREHSAMMFAPRADGVSDAVRSDRLAVLRDTVMKNMRAIAAATEKIEAARRELAEQKDAKARVLQQQKQQVAELSQTHAEVSQEYRKRVATLSELRQRLAAVRSKLSTLLGRKIDAKDIVEAAKIASKATGVRKDFILGELVVETSLGTYTGGCTYKRANMTKANRDALKSIAKELDINYKKVKLSCAPGYGHGGAMGVAQFMPTTWLGYKSRIAAATGHHPPDPWNLTDGVMAMALYLKDKGAGSKKGEFVAAKRYYCGSSRSRYWNTRCNDYARKVLYWADNYERLLK